MTWGNFIIYFTKRQKYTAMALVCKDFWHSSAEKTPSHCGSDYSCELYPIWTRLNDWCRASSITWVFFTSSIVTVLAIALSCRKTSPNFISTKLNALKFLNHRFSAKLCRPSWMSMKSGKGRKWQSYVPSPQPTFQHSLGAIALTNHCTRIQDNSRV